MWPNELIENCITNRYYHSELLGKVAALNIYEKFENCLSQLVKNKLLQVSSDDPNVNTGFQIYLMKTGLEQLGYPPHQYKTW